MLKSTKRSMDSHKFRKSGCLDFAHCDLDLELLVEDRLVFFGSSESASKGTGDEETTYKEGLMAVEEVLPAEEYGHDIDDQYLRGVCSRDIPITQVSSVMVVYFSIASRLMQIHSQYDAFFPRTEMTRKFGSLNLTYVPSS